MTCPWASCVHTLRRVVICWFNTHSCLILSLKEVMRALISLAVVERYNCSSSAYHQCNHGRVSAPKQIKENQDLHQLLALLLLFLTSALQQPFLPVLMCIYLLVQHSFEKAPLYTGIGCTPALWTQTPTSATATTRHSCASHLPPLTALSTQGYTQFCSAQRGLPFK